MDGTLLRGISPACFANIFIAYDHTLYSAYKTLDTENSTVSIARMMSCSTVASSPPTKRENN